ncbi:MAG: hypothetical protein V7K21_09230 [Nostoc sp.]
MLARSLYGYAKATSAAAPSSDLCRAQSLAQPLEEKQAEMLSTGQ